MGVHKYSLANHPEARQRAIWLIRDYPNIKALVNALDGFPSGAASGPRSTLPHSSTEDAATKRAELSIQTDAVEKAMQAIPMEYRRGVWRSIVYRERYPETASLKTWKKWRQRFIYLVAYSAGYI